LLASGALPTGLSLSGTKGTISGTPTKAGSFSFTVQVHDSSSPPVTATSACSLAIAVAITPEALPLATVKTAYSVTLSASGGTDPYKWKLASGTLPAGLSLSGTKGTISGTPTKAGPFTFTVQADDSAHPTALSATTRYTLTVN
jgi:hypothetical protein